MWLWIIGIAIVLILVIWFVTTYNRFMSLTTRAEEAFSGMDVFMKKRYDLIPNLVATVKGYAAHEKDTFDAVVTARGNALSATPDKRAAEEGELSQALSRLMMLTENYPQLKADTQFTSLQQELSQIESEIERSRRFYNGIVGQLNVAIKQIPSNLVAIMARIEPRAFFELDTPAERQNVKVEF